MTRYRIVAVMLVLLAGLCLWWAWPAPRQGQVEQRWLPVAPQLLERRLGLVGRIEAAQRVTVAAPFEGVVQALPVQVGERVQAGQTLAVLDTAQLDIQLRQAEAERLKARSAVRSLQAWASGPEVTRALRAQVAARRTLSANQATLAATRRLYEQGIVARLEVENLEQQVSAQAQELASADDELRLTRARGQGEALQIAEMELANAQARHAALLALRARATLVAPFASLVARPVGDGQQPGQLAQAGQLLSQGMPLLALVELERLQVAATVQEGDLGLLHEGMSVQVTGEGFAGQVLPGQVASLGLQAREDEGQGAWFDLLVTLPAQPDLSAQGVRPGMSAQVSVLLYRNEQGIALPAQVLRSDAAGGAYVLFRAHPGEAPRPVPVQLGQSVAQGVEVSGLTAGEVLLPEGQ
ncbi:MULTISPECIES: efflux RND transporter periplasmic adaptor subunit [Pseudomonas]|jgi:multidrug efflux pump subunit AcrA (membrane-fusion protein)|uniref:HlyD family efflux transporter periplasmic adaptor subunit n=1 Tax=Pseudomonas mosselii TaxID=78327 RepID=A0A5R8Z568_9PSED|nr:HlyD family efflux transporter periplasmic adaptor subunit [Pseudomonas mosselii]TLP60086.1 HlyD family efflux transporter periplasmic adaptor subunit [Pseudomonas mosselii]